MHEQSPRRAVEPIQQIAEQSCGDEVARWVVEGCPELGVNAAPVRLLGISLTSFDCSCEEILTKVLMCPPAS